VRSPEWASINTAGKVRARRQTAQETGAFSGTQKDPGIEPEGTQGTKTSRTQRLQGDRRVSSRDNKIGRPRKDKEFWSCKKKKGQAQRARVRPAAVSAPSSRSAPATGHASHAEGKKRQGLQGIRAERTKKGDTRYSRAKGAAGSDDCRTGPYAHPRGKALYGLASLHGTLVDDVSCR